MLPFCCHRGLSNGEMPLFTGFFTGAKLFDIKCNEWLGSDYAQYLRPQTLFGTKFESYLNSIDTVKPKKDFDILSTYETL